MTASQIENLHAQGRIKRVTTAVSRDEERRAKAPAGRVPPPFSNRPNSDADQPRRTSTRRGPAGGQAALPRPFPSEWLISHDLIFALPGAHLPAHQSQRRMGRRTQDPRGWDMVRRPPWWIPLWPARSRRLRRTPRHRAWPSWRMAAGQYDRHS